jgi:hypothetical protein
LLRSLDGIRATAGKLQNDLIELHNIVRFDHQSSSARERTQRLEAEMTRLTEALRHFREQFDSD